MARRRCALRVERREAFYCARDLEAAGKKPRPRWSSAWATQATATRLPTGAESMATNRQSSPSVRQAPPRASHCSADPSCVWPVAAEGVCVHHYRMFREPEAVLGTMLGSVKGPETEAQQLTISAVFSAALRAPQFAESTAPPTVGRPQNSGTVRHCRNQSCGTHLGANNRSGLCKRCGDRMRAFNVRRARRGAARWLSFEQYEAARSGLRM